MKKTAFLLTFLASLSLPMGLIADTWDGGGGDNDYANGLNWGADAVPGPVNADILQNVNVTLDTAQASSARLRVENGAGASLTINAGGSLLNLNHIRLAELAGTAGTLSLSGGNLRVNATTQNVVGFQGAGTLNVGSGSTYSNVGGSNLVVGYTGGGSGTINVTGGSMTLPNTFVVGRDSAGTLNVSSGTVDVNRSFNIGNLAGGNGVVNLTGTGYIDGTGVLIGSQIGNSGSGTVNIQDTARLRLGDRDLSIGNNNSGSGTVNLTSGTFSVGNAIFLGQAGSATGVVTQDGGLFESRNSNIVVGRQGNAQGTYVMNGGTMSAASTLYVGRANNSIGVFNQTGGDVFVGNNLDFGNSTGSSAVGTYTLSGGSLRVGSQMRAPAEGHFVLNGGTLRVNRIVDTLDSFTWNGGTLTSAQAGDLINTRIDVDVTTSAGSVLDLGPIYLSGGSKQERLIVNGTLDLSAGGDLLQAVENIGFLRPIGVGAIGTGTLNLVDADTLVGTFDSFTGPTDGISQSLFDPSGDPNNLDLNTWFLEYDVANGDINFLYKVSGVAPEPTTVSLLGVAIVMLRVLRRRKYAYSD